MPVETAAVQPDVDGEQESDESQESPITCPDCGGTSFSINEEQGEVVCNNCGLVIEESIVDEAQEWRAFSAEEREAKARAGSALTYTKHDMGISTEIGSGAGELRKVPGKKRGQYYRLRKWHNRSTSSKNRNLGFALSELQRLISHLDLPRSVHEEVARLYEKSVDQGLVKGRRTEHILGALVYIVARNHGSPRTLEEIGDAIATDKRDLGKAYRYVARELDLRVLPAQPQNYLPKFAGALNVSGEVQARARKIIETVQDEGILAGKGPTGIAAAALYLAAALEGEELSQKHVAETVGVTEVTIRNRYTEFVDVLDLDAELAE